VRFDATFYSYGHPDGVVRHFSGPSLDRKPGPYNLFIAAAQLDLDLERSWMIGDRDTDVACARAAGVRAILVENPHTRLRNTPAALLAKSLSDAVHNILAAPNLDDHDIVWV
jgi:D-glycero-D-manno-heptose 1,7-bisphosphate phosphatase